MILSLLFSIDAWPLVHTDWIGDDDDNSPPGLVACCFSDFDGIGDDDDNSPPGLVACCFSNVERIGDDDDNSPFNVAEITLPPGLHDGSGREAGLCRAHSCCVV